MQHKWCTLTQLHTAQLFSVCEASASENLQSVPNAHPEAAGLSKSSISFGTWTGSRSSARVSLNHRSTAELGRARARYGAIGSTLVDVDEKKTTSVTEVSSGGKQISWNYKLERKQRANESTAYIVVEHAPQSCSEYPPSGGITFSNIYVEVDYKPVAQPAWRVEQEKPACNSKAVLVDDTTVRLEWDSSMPSPSVHVD